MLRWSFVVFFYLLWLAPGFAAAQTAPDAFYLVSSPVRTTLNLLRCENSNKSRMTIRVEARDRNNLVKLSDRLALPAARRQKPSVTLRLIPNSDRNIRTLRISANAQLRQRSRCNVTIYRLSASGSLLARKLRPHSTRKLSGLDLRLTRILNRASSLEAAVAIPSLAQLQSVVSTNASVCAAADIDHSGNVTIADYQLGLVKFAERRFTSANMQTLFQCMNYVSPVSSASTESLDGISSSSASSASFSASFSSANSSSVSPPQQPRNLTLTDVGDHRQVDVSWIDSSQNEAGFSVQRESLSGGVWGQPQTLSTLANVTTLRDAPGAGIHRYRVRANNEAGSSEFSSYQSIQISPPLVGWSSFNLKSGARIVYVSNSQGNDANSGLAESSPKRSIAAGMSLLREASGDWILLKKGDEWREAFGGLNYLSGHSAEYPTLLGSYGSGARPRLLVPFNLSGVHIGGTVNFVAIVGIEFYASARDPHSPDWNGDAPIVGQNGIMAAHSGEFLLVEDCRFRFFSYGLTFSGGSTGILNVTVRRNVFEDGYGIMHSSQGIFTATAQNILVEENVFDRNGYIDVVPAQALGTAHYIDATRSLIIPSGFASYTWRSGDLIHIRQPSQPFCGTSVVCNIYRIASKTSDNEIRLERAITSDGSDAADVWVIDSTATKFNHNIYFSNGTGIIARRNIVSRGSSHGFQVRPGGLVEDNLFARNAYSVFVGRTDSVMRNNVVLNGRNINSFDDGGDAMAVNHLPNALVENNIVAHIMPGVSGVAFGVGSSSSDPLGRSMTVAVRNNIVWDWDGIGLYFSAATAERMIGMDFSGNRVSASSAASVLAAIRPSTFDPVLRFVNNSYSFAVAAPYRNSFAIGTYWLSLPDWLSLTGDTSTVSLPHYVDPNRTIERYNHDRLGRVMDYDDFMNEARKQSRDNWREEYTATAVNQYIRQGFEVQ